MLFIIHGLIKSSVMLNAAAPSHGVRLNNRAELGQSTPFCAADVLRTLNASNICRSVGLLCCWMGSLFETLFVCFVLGNMASGGAAMRSKAAANATAASAPAIAIGGEN